MADAVELMPDDSEVYEVSPASEREPKSQYETRETRIFRDQHGRRWTCRVEKRSQQPVGRWSAVDFTAPLDVPGEYMSIVATEDGTNQVQIDYARWVDVLEAAHREYADRERKLLQTKFDADWHQYVNDVPPEIRQFLGPRPDPVEPVVAAMQHNSWVLGLSTRVDLRVAPFLTVPEPIKPVSRYGDFSDAALDAEEDADPDAVGGKVVPVKRGPGRPRKDEAV